MVIMSRSAHGQEKGIRLHQTVMMVLPLSSKRNETQ